MRHKAAALGILLMATPAQAGVHAALAASDSRAVHDAVVERYLAAGGVSWNEFTRWTLKPFDWVFNYYDPIGFEIVIGAAPTPEETARYWENWSATLAGGQWNAQAFFADEEEAHLLAGYNQLMLAAHEAGHALMYRYDPEHHKRHGYAVNCRELYADRFAVALVKELSAADPLLARLEARYGEMMASFNMAVASEHRHHIASLDALKADCAAVHVAQPTPETLQPYASAFFERQRLLLEAGPEPLAALYDTLLLPHGDSGWPYRADVGPVETVSHLPQLRYGANPAGEDGSQREAIPAFSADGDLFTVTVERRPGDEPGESHELHIGFAPAGAEPETVAAGLRIEGLAFVAMSFRPQAAIVLDPDRFLFAVELITDTPRRGYQVLVAATRREGQWSASVTPLDETVTRARLAHAPDGGVLIETAYLQQYAQPWHTSRLDPDTLAIGEEQGGEEQGLTTLDLRYPGLRDGKGGRLIDHSYTVVRYDERGNFRDVVAGRAFAGHKDAATGRLAEFGMIRAMHVLKDRNLIVMHDAPQGGILLRRVVISGD